MKKHLISALALAGLAVAIPLLASEARASTRTKPTRTAVTDPIGNPPPMTSLGRPPITPPSTRPGTISPALRAPTIGT